MSQMPEFQDSPETAQVRQAVQKFQETYGLLKAEIQKFIVGQDQVVEGVLTALLAGGHVLLEGVPGIGKTMLVKTLGEAMHLDMSRIQFTPDLMPADILGNMVLQESADGHREVSFQAGPIHTNLLLADEINRATPKTQSALLEAMQEHQVTVAGATRPLPQPFVVLATQNPVEQEGTYPLPEAQLDRFLFKLLVGYPKEEEYSLILSRTTGKATPKIQVCTEEGQIQAMRDLVREVPVPENARTTAVRLMMATQPNSPYATERVNRYVQLGSSPRGAQGMLLAGKVRALVDGRFAVAAEDVKEMATDALRHRMLLNFEAIGEGITTDDLCAEILERSN